MAAALHYGGEVVSLSLDVLREVRTRCPQLLLMFRHSEFSLIKSISQGTEVSPIMHYGISMSARTTS